VPSEDSEAGYPRLRAAASHRPGELREVEVEEGAEHLAVAVAPAPVGRCDREEVEPRVVVGDADEILEELEACLVGPGQQRVVTRERVARCSDLERRLDLVVVGLVAGHRCDAVDLLVGGIGVVEAVTDTYREDGDVTGLGDRA
jgi:hypothetical protein